MAIEDRSCNCGRPDGIHESWCRSNDLHAMYKCCRCGKVVPQYVMAHGMCPGCQKEEAQNAQYPFMATFHKAFKESFIGSFSLLTYDLRDHYAPDNSGPRYMRISATCYLSIDYRYLGKEENLQMKVQRDVVHRDNDLQNEGFCEFLAKDIGNSILKEFPKVKEEVENKYGMVTAITFRMVH